MMHQVLFKYHWEVKSFTLKPKDTETQGSIGVLPEPRFATMATHSFPPVLSSMVCLRWSKDQMYVSPVPVDEETGAAKCTQEFLSSHKIKVNSNGGATLSVKKHQGWPACFSIAKTVAMW